MRAYINNNTMKSNGGMIARIILLVVCLSLQAQTQFNFNGVGRALVTNNKLGGPLTDGDSLSLKKGLSGYTLFDLKPNITVGNNLKANAILRVRNPIGSFFGASTAFTFRQLYIGGRIAKVIDYEIGDIYFGEDMTEYTVNNPEEMYVAYESDIHKMRRSIVEYENFVDGNQWRLQGTRARSVFKFHHGIEKIGLSAFFTRINPTNDKDVSDQIMAGGRGYLVQSKLLKAGATYIALTDIPIGTNAMEYENNVTSGDIHVNFDQEAFAILADFEGGISDFKNTLTLADSSVFYQDYFYDGKLAGVVKPAKVKLFVGYKNVGPQFSSPAAQTIRLNNTRTPELFSSIQNNFGTRTMGMFDRMTDEFLYNRSINPVLQSFLPEYGNVTPYGNATPNRTGLSFGLASDTSFKYATAELRVDNLAEITGEGTETKRAFSSIKGGAVIKIGQIAKIDRKLNVNVGFRQEKTTRGGDAPVDFSSTLMDAGASLEVLKKFDLLVGYKSLKASGKEYLMTRNVFNVASDYTPYNLDLTESILSGGFGLRFGEKSYFTLNYNKVTYTEKVSSKFDYTIDQLFFNYTLIF
jgi:hypothetical protein